MCDITTEGAGMAIGAGETSLTTCRSDVERDADNFAAVRLVDPLSLFIGDEAGSWALMVFVGMVAIAEKATVGQGGLRLQGA
jgi:hypothetical protein